MIGNGSSAKNKACESTSFGASGFQGPLEILLGGFQAPLSSSRPQAALKCPRRSDRVTGMDLWRSRSAMRPGVDIEYSSTNSNVTT